jgi:serine/threonine protein kinase
MTDNQLQPPSTSPSAEADDERPTHPSFSSSSADLDVAPEAVYDLTDKKYIPISPAGAGTCARLLFCSAIPKQHQTPQLVVVKIPSDQWHRRLRLANEIKVLSHIRALPGSWEIAKHFPTLISFASTEPSAARWLSMSPIHGFSLYQLKCVIQPLITPSSGERDPRPALQLPQLLIFHIAKQLLWAVEWLHQEGITHGDIFDGNVMLDVSVFHQYDNDDVWTWRLPNVVLIDFDVASLTPSDTSKMNDRAFVFQLLGVLCSLVSLEDNTALSQVELLWWDGFRHFLAASTVRSRHSVVPSFAVFRERFGGEIDRRLERVTEAETITTRLLIEDVMRREVKFPSEEEVGQALRKWTDDCRNRG